MFWFLQVECFYVVTEAPEALTETVTVRSLYCDFYHWSVFTGEKSQYAWSGQLKNGGGIHH